MSYDTTYHRDQTVSVWDVYVQEWIRTDHPSDRVLASLDREERDRVLLHCAGIRLTRKWSSLGQDLPSKPGCPNCRCGGNVCWIEARRRKGSLQTRTVWSNAGAWCAGTPVDADAADVIAAS